MSFDWIFKLIISIFYLFLATGIGCFLGAILEYKNWLKFSSFLTKPLVKLGNLSEVSGTAFITAFVSGNAANSAIASAYKENQISRREMIVSAIINTFPRKVNSMMRVIYIIPLLGKIGLFYILIQIGIGAIRTILVLFYNRIYSDNKSNNFTSQDTLLEIKPDTWGWILKKSYSRTLKLWGQIAKISIPIYILVKLLDLYKILELTQTYIPEFITNYCNADMITIIFARCANLISACKISSSFMIEHDLSSTQILIALLIGNIFTMPLRVLRRNIPATLGIFDKKDCLIIVIITQLFRLIANLIIIFYLV